MMSIDKLSNVMISNNSKLEGLLLENNEVVADRIMADNIEFRRMINAQDKKIKDINDEIDQKFNFFSQRVEENLKNNFGENMLFNQSQYERLVVMDDKVQSMQLVQKKNRRMTGALMFVLGSNTLMLGLLLYWFFTSGGI